MQDTLAPISISAPQAEEFFPLALARNYAFPLQHHVIGGQPFFAVQDWIGGLTDCKSPSRLWSQIKRRATAKGFAFSGRILKLPYRAANGRVYQMDFAELKPLYEIALRLRVRDRFVESKNGKRMRVKAESPVLNSVWRYLWDAGVMLNKVDPSKVEDWIAWMHNTRGNGVYKGLFMQAIQDAVECPAPRFQLSAYVKIFNHVARKLRRLSNLPADADLLKFGDRRLMAAVFESIATIVRDDQLFLPLKTCLSTIDAAIVLTIN
jgi:hypothetical protein